MKILGIESSCDETAAAVIEDGKRLLSNVVNSQINIHAAYGGVVPEVAARSHIEVILPVINQALTQANCTWDDIDAIAVTYAPGLIGSLLIGSLAARTLAILKNKPLYPIHHVEAHVYANFITKQSSSASPTPSSQKQATLRHKDASALSLHSAELASLRQSSDSQEKTNSLAGQLGNVSSRSDSSALLVSSQPLPSLTRTSAARVSSDVGTRIETRSEAVLGGEERAGEQLSLILPSKQPAFPLLALIVSGGHSQLVLFQNHGNYQLLGQTQDDAIGEAFDKVAKILGLPYPGGPSIAKAAQKGNPKAHPLPKARLQNPYDFSFSGLKTAVLRAVQREVGVDITFPSHELQTRLNEAQKADFAASFQHVAIETLVDKAEQAFKDYSPASVVIAGGVAANLELRRQLSERLPLAIEYAPIQLCTDNAAMIATLAYYYAQTQPPTDPYNLEVIPSLSMTKTAWNLQPI